MKKTAASISRQEQDKEWACILQSSRSTSKRRAASSGIYHRYQKGLVFYFLKSIGIGANILDAQDLTIATLEKTFGCIKKYHPSKGAFSTWVYSIALNTLIDHKRASRSVDVFSIDAVNDQRGLNERFANQDSAPEFYLTCPDIIPSDNVQRQQSHQIVREVVEAIKNKNEREVIKLRFFDELSYKEVAERTGIPLNTVKIHILRGQEKLKEQLERKLELRIA
jgi:RNA polymerase sigma factor (sigma-70 family)